MRIKSKNKVSDTDKLLEERRNLKSKNDAESKIKLQKIENELSEKCAEKNFQFIKNEIKGIHSEEGGVNSNKLWKLKNKMISKPRDLPSAKVDQFGNIVATEAAYKKLNVDTYKNRLREREVKAGKEKMHEYNMELFELNRKIAKSNKTKPWTNKQVIKVLRSLKKGKSRDPWGLSNELFRPDVASSDLVEAITNLMNEIKRQGKVPEMLKLANISSFYKGKGAKNDIENERGIFRIVILRYILDRLIYNDEYEGIDSNLTDCNVGCRKNRNIRDNLFVLNGIINFATENESDLVEIQIMDLEKCFDALSLHYTINDLFDIKLNNDNLELLYKENETSLVKIKTPY